MSDAVAAPAIIIPGVTRDGEFTSGLPNKRKRDKDRQDPRKSRRPELPVQGPGRGGRVGASATQHVVQNLVRDTTRDEDVRVNFFFPILPFVSHWGILVCWWINRSPGLIRCVSMRQSGMARYTRSGDTLFTVPALKKDEGGGALRIGVSGHVANSRESS